MEYLENRINELKIAEKDECASTEAKFIAKTLRLELELVHHHVAKDIYKK